ncbi:type II secretion system F family protein [Bordetella sp. 2513F-2]
MFQELAVILGASCVAVLVHVLGAPLWSGKASAPPRTDPALPWWWRALWPWSSGLARLVMPLLSWKARARWERRKARAGLPPQVGEADLAALAWAAILGGAGAGFLLGAWLGGSPWLAALLGGMSLGMAPRLWLARVAAERRRRIDRDLPFVLDLMTLCVEAGLGLHGALQQSAQCGPPGPLRDALEGALADMRAGLSRGAAMKKMAQRSGSAALAAWVAVLAQADAMGMSLGPLMRGQAAQCRADRYQRAERLAMEAPVKMLFPLIGCIFPCTFIVLGFPIALQLLPALQSP